MIHETESPKRQVERGIISAYQPDEPLRGRVLFVVLAHEREDILREQVLNIQHFNPSSSIVLYNSSGNPAFGTKIENIIICPYSRGPLAWGRTGRVLYDVMRWLRETGAAYEYLVYIDSDVLFLREGLETFLDEKMQGIEMMGVDLHVEYAPGGWLPGQSMWREWGSWRDLFQTDYLAGMFANGQIFRKSLVDRIHEGIDTALLEHLFEATQVVALEEILHATLGVRSGAVYLNTPEPASHFIRFVPHFNLQEIQRAAQRADVYFVHPVLRDFGDPARDWTRWAIGPGFIPRRPATKKAKVHKRRLKSVRDRRRVTRRVETVKNRKPLKHRVRNMKPRKRKTSPASIRRKGGLR